MPGTAQGAGEGGSDPLPPPCHGWTGGWQSATGHTGRLGGGGQPLTAPHGVEPSLGRGCWGGGALRLGDPAASPSPVPKYHQGLELEVGGVPAEPPPHLGHAVGGGVFGFGAGHAPVPGLLAGLVVPPRRLVVHRQPLHRVRGQSLGGQPGDGERPRDPPKTPRPPPWRRGRGRTPTFR